MALFGDRLEYRRMSSGGINCVHHPDLSPISDYEYCEQVIQHLTAQLNAHPQEARVYVLRGNAYLDQRRFQLAIDDYTRALELMPNDPIAYNNRGIAYRSLGDPAQALADYRQALVLDGTYRDAYNNLGLALSDVGDFAAAVQAYTQAIAIDPHDWHAYNNRGLALWALRRQDEALRDYAKVKELLASAPGRGPAP
jgi:Flp pilus assembly protein TadD